MYSRSTDRGGRRIKLPPGYDGSAFRHDTGEIRQYTAETEMKIHSPEPVSDEMIGAEKRNILQTAEERQPDIAAEAAEPQEAYRELVPLEKAEPETEADGEEKASFLEGLLAGLGSEEWLLFLVILLLVADGSDAWDVIALLGLLLAVR